MTGKRVVLEDLPSEIAVFPLTGALLLPRGKLPLNIFEPRYLALVEDAMKNGRMFGMIQPDGSGSQRRSEEEPALYQVGCLGRLSAFSETEDGRLLITLTGVTRFRVLQECPPRRGYRQIRADFAPFAEDLDLEPVVLGNRRGQIFGALREYFNARGLDANWDAIQQMPDEALVVTLAMACPFDPAEKQALLEAPTEADRAVTLLTLLQMAAHAGGDGEARAN